MDVVNPLSGGQFLLHWCPTFRCNYNCSYCYAINFPVDVHGREVDPQAWLNLFDEIPFENVTLICGGRETTLYTGFDKVLRGVHWGWSLETNLWLNPKNWLDEDLSKRCWRIATTLHFAPENPKATEFAENFDILVDQLGPEKVLFRYVVEQKERPSIEVDVREFMSSKVRDFEKVQSIFIPCSSQWNRVGSSVLTGGWFRSCSAGFSGVWLAPDMSLHRCFPQLFRGEKPLGVLSETGWDSVLSEPLECHKIFCKSRCDGQITDPPLIPLLEEDNKDE